MVNIDGFEENIQVSFLYFIKYLDITFYEMIFYSIIRIYYLWIWRRSMPK